MKVSAEFITFFIACVFTLAGVFNYFLADHIWPLFWVVAFVALLATIGIDIIDRLHIEKRERESTGDEKLPWMTRRQK